MGVHSSPADSLSRWRGHGRYVPTVEELLRRDEEVTVGDLVSRLQSAELEEAEEMEPMEYVD
jgi:hypothetical protein